MCFDETVWRQCGNVSCTVANYTICQNVNALTYLWVQLTKVVLYNGHKEVIVVNVQFFILKFLTSSLQHLVMPPLFNAYGTVLQALCYKHNYK